MPRRGGRSIPLRLPRARIGAVVGVASGQMIKDSVDCRGVEREAEHGDRSQRSIGEHVVACRETPIDRRRIVGVLSAQSDDAIAERDVDHRGIKGLGRESPQEREGGLVFAGSDRHDHLVLGFPGPRIQNLSLKSVEQRWACSRVGQRAQSLRGATASRRSSIGELADRLRQSEGHRFSFLSRLSSAVGCGDAAC
jgi:hypothetical protein